MSVTEAVLIGRPPAPMREAARRRGQPWLAAWLPVAAIGVLLAGLYAGLGIKLVLAWQIDPNYSHGPLLLLAVLALAARVAWTRRAEGVETGSAISRRDQIQGLITIAAALALHAVAWLLNFMLLDAVSLVGLILGLVCALGGRGARQAYGFPAILILLTVPLPVAWYQPIAAAMQQLVSTASASILTICGASVYREGYLVHLGGLTMEVGAACSGLRQLTAFVALGAILSHVSGRGAAYGAALIAFSAFTAIVANVVRVLLTGAILMVAGPKWAAGAFHTLEGLATLAIGACVLVLAAVALARLQDRRHQRRRNAAETDAAPSQHAATTPVCPGLDTSSSVRRLASPAWGRIAVLALLSIALLVEQFAEHRIQSMAVPVATQLKAPLASLPRELGPWQGVDVPTPSTAAVGDQRVHRVYRNRETGQQATVWITYSAAGEDRAHHPDVCMAAAGKVEDVGHRRTVPLAERGAPALESHFGGADGISTWYWHYALASPTTESADWIARTYQRARQRRASVTLEVLCRDEDPSQREAARQLTRLVDDAARAILPSASIRGNDRLPVGNGAAT